MSDTLKQFRRVYNFHDPDAKGRTCVLIFTIIEGFLGYITSGIFYTEFLQGYGVNITGAGLLSFAPFLASMLVFFAPKLLEHFPRRRWLLATCKLLYYFCNIIGLTLMPVLLKDPDEQLTAMIVISFLSSLFNVIASAGYGAWHIRFQPEEVRSYHMTVTQFSSNFVSGVLMLTAGWLCDRLPWEFIIGLRYFAFALGVVAVVFLLLPREVDYPVSRRPRFSDIITVPMRNRKFVLTMLIIFFWQFAQNCYTAQFNYYLLDTIGMSQSFYNAVIFLYGIAFVLFANFWRKRIMRKSWLYVFALTFLLLSPLQIFYALVLPGNVDITIGTLAMTIPLYIPMALAARLPQHFLSVGHNIAFANLPYINMPVEDRDACTSFYLIVANLGCLAGMVFGIVFTELTAGQTFELFGHTYVAGPPLLAMVCGIVEFFVAVPILLFRRHLEPSAEDGARA